MADNSDGVRQSTARERVLARAAQHRQERERQAAQQPAQQPQVKPSTMQPLVEAAAQEPVRQEARTAIEEGRRPASQESLEADLFNAGRDIRVLSAERDSLRGQVRTLLYERDTLAAQRNELSGQVRTLQGELQGNRARVAELEALLRDPQPGSTAAAAPEGAPMTFEGFDRIVEELAAQPIPPQGKIFEGEEFERWLLTPAREGIQERLVSKGLEWKRCIRLDADMKGALRELGVQKRQGTVVDPNNEVISLLPLWLAETAQEHAPGSVEPMDGLLRILPDEGRRRVVKIHGEEYYIWKGSGVGALEAVWVGGRMSGAHLSVHTDYSRGIRTRGSEIRVMQDVPEMAEAADEPDGVPPPDVVAQRRRAMEVREDTEEPDGVAPEAVDRPADIREPLIDGLSARRRGAGDFNPEGNPEGGGFGSTM